MTSFRVIPYCERNTNLFISLKNNPEDDVLGVVAEVRAENVDAAAMHRVVLYADLDGNVWLGHNIEVFEVDVTHKLIVHGGAGVGDVPVGEYSVLRVRTRPVGRVELSAPSAEVARANPRADLDIVDPHGYVRLEIVVVKRRFGASLE